MGMAIGYAILGATASATAAAVVGAVVVGAITFTASYLMTKKAMGNASSGMDSNEYTQMIKTDKAARRVIYGERMISGVMAYAEEEQGAQDEGEKLLLAIYVCDHPVSEVSKILLNDKESTEYGGNARYVISNGDNTGSQWMRDNGATQFSEEMQGDGACWMGWSLTFNRTYFTQIPTPKLIVKGKDTVLDYRSDTRGYTNNAALVIADFLVNYMNVKETRIITSGWANFLDAANLCDQMMETGERRYTINGMFELADQKPSDILNAMLKACGGTLVRMNGQIGLLPAAYYGAPTVTIGESDIISGIEVIPQEEMSSAANMISGSFISPDDDYSKVDFPPVYDLSAIARDGYEIDDTVDYDLVTNKPQAQRLSSIELRRRTLGSHINFTAGMRGLYCRVGRVIELNLPSIGVVGEYRVLEQGFSSDGVSLSLQREDIDVYDDAVGTPYSPPPILNLPTGGIGSPTGLQFLTEAIGDTIQGRVVWTEVTLAESYDVQLQDIDSENMVFARSTEATNVDVSGISLGNYTARVRAKAASGKVSGWSEVSFIISRPEIATSVEITRSNWNIQLVPAIDGGVAQGTLFEFYYLDDPESYITGQPSHDANDFPSSTKVGTSSSLNHGGLFPDRWQHYWIITKNSYGASEAYYLQTGTTKEQDLVTTVVERLVAIEIQSQNWEPDETTGISPFGYKLFSPNSAPVTMPDGTVLENPDGLAVFQNAIINGHLTAESLTFTAGTEIPPEIDNSKVISVKTYRQPDEPEEPLTVGSIWYDTDNGNKQYRWSGASWESVIDNDIAKAIQDAANAQSTADGKIESFFQDSQPTTGSEGDIWFDTNDGNKQYVFKDGSWELAQDTEIGDAIIAAQNAQSTADGKATTFYQATEPSDADSGEGDLWIDTDDNNRQYRYSGSEWVDVRDTGIIDDGKSSGALYPNQDSIQIKSSNYQQGVAGWAIDKDGNSEFNNTTVRGKLFASDIEGDVYSTLTWDIRSQQSHMAYRGVPSEVEYLNFNITCITGMSRILVIPPIECDTQGFRLYEDGNLILEFESVDDPEGFDDITRQVYCEISNTKEYGESINYSLRTYDYINPASPITSKAIRIPEQVVQMYYGKADIVISP